MLHWGQMEGMEVACDRRLRPKWKLRRHRQQDGSWGKGRGCYMLERRDRVCSFSYALWCSLSYYVPWVLEKLCLWYDVFGATLDQNLKKLLVIPFFVKGLRAPGLLLHFWDWVIAYFGLQACHSIFWKFIPGQSRQVWRQVAVTASNTWRFWIAWCHLSQAVAYGEQSRRISHGSWTKRTWQVCCGQTQQ